MQLENEVRESRGCLGITILFVALIAISCGVVKSTASTKPTKEQKQMVREGKGKVNVRVGR